MKPHIRRRWWIGIGWVWGVWLRGRHFSHTYPDYHCTQLSVIKDILRGKEFHS